MTDARKRMLAVNVPCLESRRVFFDEEAADFIIFTFCPDDGDIGDRAVCDPHFFAVEDVAVAIFYGAREHARGIRAELRLGQTEAADGLALL